jgi:hypothetical protein
MTRASLGAVRLADGWYGFALDVAATARSLGVFAKRELGSAGKGASSRSA